MILIILWSRTCPLILKICEDGSHPGRGIIKCFKDCPEKKYCDALAACPEDYRCFKFPDDEQPYCYKGNDEHVCFNKCQSFECEIIETDPLEVICTDRLDNLV